jgi:hypothetical protein
MTTTFLLKLVGNGGSGIRGMRDADGVNAYAVYEFLTKFCGYRDAGNTARKEFSRLVKDGSEFKDEVLSMTKYLKFPGQGQRETPCMTIRGLQRLLMILGGKVSAEYRALIESTFTRVMAGDQSLIEVINANAASTAPVQQAFREALAQEPAAPVLDEMCGVKRREREELELDMDLVERKLRLEETRLRLDETRRANAMQHTAQALTLIDTIKHHAALDERTKLQFEDHIKNLILPPAPARLLTDAGQAPSVSETAALNVSIVAKELGFSKCSDGDLIKLGRAMAARYREAYQRDPPKHKQYVRGNYVPVNSYMERDRPMMEQVIRSHFGADTESDDSNEDV